MFLLIHVKAALDVDYMLFGDVPGMYTKRRAYIVQVYTKPAKGVKDLPGATLAL